jgi:hypothetical protein
MLPSLDERHTAANVAAAQLQQSASKATWQQSAPVSARSRLLQHVSTTSKPAAQRPRHSLHASSGGNKAWGQPCSLRQGAKYHMISFCSEARASTIEAGLPAHTAAVEEGVASGVAGGTHLCALSPLPAAKLSVYALPCAHPNRRRCERLTYRDVLIYHDDALQITSLSWLN